MQELFLSDTAATMALGATLARECATASLSVIYLQGELGSGKTTLVQGFLRELGYIGVVKSPTYTLVEPYEIATKKIFHFDLYRLNAPQELLAIGIQDYVEAATILLIEWPDCGGTYLPAPTHIVTLHTAQAGRQAQITTRVTPS